MPDNPIRYQIEATAGYYPPATYGLGTEPQISGLLTFYHDLQLNSDPQTSFYIPITSVRPNTKVFAVGVLPPTQNVTGRRLDRSQTIGVAFVDVPEQSAKQRVMDFAEAELARWQGLTEQDPTGKQYIKEYHDTIEQAYNGTSAWSGAFVSHVVANASPGSLALSASHAIYSLRAKQGGPGQYRALDPATTQIEPGDIIIKNRGNSDATFDSLGKAHNDHFDSHGDIVTEVSGGSVRSIGGNVSSGTDRGTTVGVTNVRLDSRGRVASPKYFAILRIVEDTTEFTATNPVAGDANKTPRWKDSGAASAGQANAELVQLADTKMKLSNKLRDAQNAQIIALQKSLLSMAKTPPLRLLVNPNKFSVKSQKIVSDGNWTRNGHVIEFWGDDQDKISGSGQVAAYYALLTNPGLGQGGPGLTRAARNHSEAWQNLQSLWLLYRNNGGLYTQDYGQHERDVVLATVGSIYIFYDDILYIGSFDSFNISETDTKAFTAEYDFEFTVRAAFMLDSPDEKALGVPQAGRGRRQATLPTQSPQPTPIRNIFTDG